jgi:hypothetical protein
MGNTLKKVLALVLSVLLLLGCLTACGGGEAQETTAPVATEDPAEAKALKVLTIGHSLSNDANYMLSMIAAAEGYEDLTVGYLYYSGCPLNKHVQFMNSNSPEYKLYTSSTATAKEVPATMDNVSMLDGITHDYWDIIILQGGVFEIAENEAYTDGNIQKIQAYVNEHKKNPNAIFAWNMAWAPPVDDALRATKSGEPNSYIENYKKFDHKRENMYAAVTKCVQDNIVTDETFAFVIPSATVFENALSSYYTEKDMHRDYAHATDLARVMVTYTWFCKLTGIEQLTEIKLNAIPRNFFNSIKLAMPEYVLTDAQKALILETVNNALKNPFQMTRSQYTEAPADYMPMW